MHFALAVTASHPPLRLRRRHETGQREWTALPEPPSGAAAYNVVHSEPGKLFLVLPRGPDIGDQQSAAGPQHAYGFADCFGATGPSADVVNRHTGEDQIKAVVLKGQCPDVPVMQFDAIRHALEVPAVIKVTQPSGYVPDGRTAAETAAFFRREVEAMGEAVRAAGIQPN